MLENSGDERRLGHRRDDAHWPGASRGQTLKSWKFLAPKLRYVRWRAVRTVTAGFRIHGNKVHRVRCYLDFNA